MATITGSPATTDRRRKTDLQLQTTPRARAAAPMWNSKLIVIRSLVNKDLKKDPNAEASYGPQIVEAEARGYRAQNKTMLLFLIYAACESWIVPMSFADVHDKTCFCGWMGFLVVNSPRFEQELRNLFSSSESDPCQDDTIHTFFRRTAQMKPKKSWALGFSGVEPFVWCPKSKSKASHPAPTSHDGNITGLHGFNVCMSSEVPTESVGEDQVNSTGPQDIDPFIYTVLPLEPNFSDSHLDSAGLDHVDPMIDMLRSKTETMVPTLGMESVYANSIISEEEDLLLSPPPSKRQRTAGCMCDSMDGSSTWSEGSWSPQVLDDSEWGSFPL